MSETETYEIFAIKYGERTQRIRAENFIMADNHDAPEPLDFFVWVIRNETRTILVDTGFDRREAARRDRSVLREPVEALALLGIDAAKLSTVIVTHLHFDHAGTLDAFTGATFHLQAAEMAFATGPCMCHPHMRAPFTADHVCAMVRNVYSGRVVFHDGDGEVAPGVSVHHMGGHSRGLQAVRVMTARGPVMLASDASHFYEHVETGKVFPIVVNVEETLEGYKRLKRLAASRQHIIPGHDPLVLKRYPALSPATAGIVHRLDLPPLT
ncbi:MAG: N-acyl homoserine lactonase family protein [Hyphomicrobiaceae bacterium]